MSLKITKLLELDVTVHDVGKVCSWPSIRIDTHVENADLPNSRIKSKLRRVPRNPTTE